MTQSSPPPDEKLPFNEQALATMKSAANEVLATHPEVRSVVVILDFHNNLRDAGISNALWLSEDGSVNTLEGINGSLQATLQIAEQMLARFDQLRRNMAQEAFIIGEELIRRKKEYADTTTQTATTAADDAGENADGGTAQEERPNTGSRPT